MKLNHKQIEQEVNGTKREKQPMLKMRSGKVKTEKVKHRTPKPSFEQ